MTDNIGLPLYLVRVWGDELNYEFTLRVLDAEQAIRVAKRIVADKKDQYVDVYKYEVHRVQ